MITIWVPKRLVEVGLYNVAARSPAELAALSEQSYRERVRYAAEKVRFSGTKIVITHENPNEHLNRLVSVSVPLYLETVRMFLDLLH